MKTFIHQSQITCEIESVKHDNPSNKGVILLHGYRQTNRLIYRQLKSVFEKDFTIIAPNGPYLVPRRNAKLNEKSYSWYFYDFNTNEYITNMDNSIKICLELIESELSHCQEISIIGFSQGGYLAPFIAQQCEKVKTIGLIGSRIRTEILKGKYHFKTIGIHGDSDPLVEFERSKKCYQEFQAQGNFVEFKEVKGLAHEINASVINELKKSFSIE